MSHSESLSRSKFQAVKRRAVSFSASEELTTTSLLQPDQPLPLVVQPNLEGLNLETWALQQRQWLETQLLQHGGILFRNFKINGVAAFEQFIQSVFGSLLDYSYRSTPRSTVSGKIYTSTEYPKDQFIPLHNEMAYSRSYPLKIWFYCVQPAAEGGATPIADSRKIYQKLDAKIKQKLIEKQIMYVRNYGGGLDLPWQTVFQTSQRQDVESYCRQAGIEWEWRSDDRLRTRQVCQAIAIHPVTGDRVWFNQAHLFHVSSLAPSVQKSLLTVVPLEDLPRNAYYGDGSAIEDAVLDEIREVYRQETVIFPWQQGDILMLDNLLTAHGRTPFVGPRRVVVGMAEPCQARSHPFSEGLAPESAPPEAPSPGTEPSAAS